MRKDNRWKKWQKRVGRPIEVNWLDTWVDGPLDFGTTDSAQANKALPQRTVGYLVAATKEGLTLARGNGTKETGAFRGLVFHPLSCIESVKELK